MPHPFLTTRQMVLPLAIALAVPMGAMAQTSGTTSGTASAPSPSTGKLTANYAQWAGSTANAQSLVTGLRTGSTVNLNGTAGTTFSPATGKLGVGEVGIALSLAKASLAQQGITNPTPAQISAALNGGMLTTANATMSVPGVLSQRASGMGWGEVAKAMGVKLGSVVSASKTDKSRAGESNSKNHGKPDGTGMGYSGDHGGGNAGAHGGGSGGGHGGGHR